MSRGGELQVSIKDWAIPDEGGDGEAERYGVSPRLVCIGEALRAVSVYCDLDLASPPSGEILELLETAYGNVASRRPEVAPTEFAVYAMSLFLDCCRNEGERRALRIGASRYIVDNARDLSRDFGVIVPDAVAAIEATVPARSVSGLRENGGEIGAIRARALKLELNIERASSERRFRAALSAAALVAILVAGGFAVHAALGLGLDGREGQAIWWSSDSQGY